MAEESDQEKTEAATPRRVEEARERGQIPRSRELNTFSVMLVGATIILFYGGQLVVALKDLMRRGFSLTRAQIHDPLWLMQMFSDLTLSTIRDFTPFLLLLLIAALVTPMALGGWSFSTESIGFNFERLNPIAGLKRLFSWQGLAELGKSIVKVLLMGWVGFWLLNRHYQELLVLGQGDLMISIGRTGELLIWGLWYLAAILIIVAAVDVPFQLWEYSHGLKMTKQELRDEIKESEGRPEIKGRIRQMQREIAKRRMLAEVPKADVVIINPTHYAVALRYDSTQMGAPRLIAKGVDFLALRIREIAKKSQVPIVTAPALARSLYYNVKLEKEIPAGLYQAVAQVLAFVYQLRRTGGTPKNHNFDNLPIPEELRY